MYGYGIFVVSRIFGIKLKVDYVISLCKLYRLFKIRFAILHQGYDSICSVGGLDEYVGCGILAVIRRAYEVHGGDLYLLCLIAKIGVDVHNVYIHTSCFEILYYSDKLLCLIGIGGHTVGDKHDTLYRAVLEKRVGITDSRCNIGCASVNLIIFDGGDLLTHFCVQAIVLTKGNDTHFGISRKLLFNRGDIFVNNVELIRHGMRNVGKNVKLGLGYNGDVGHSRRRQNNQKSYQNVHNESDRRGSRLVFLAYRYKVRYENERKHRDKDDEQIRIIEVDIYHSNIPPNL